MKTFLFLTLLSITFQSFSQRRFKCELEETTDPFIKEDIRVTKNVVIMENFKHAAYYKLKREMKTTDSLCRETTLTM